MSSAQSVMALIAEINQHTPGRYLVSGEFLASLEEQELWAYLSGYLADHCYYCRIREDSESMIFCKLSGADAKGNLLITRIDCRDQERPLDTVPVSLTTFLAQDRAAISREKYWLEAGALLSSLKEKNAGKSWLERLRDRLFPSRS